MGCLIFNMLSTKKPSNLYGEFRTRGNVSVRNTKALDDLLVPPRCRTVLFKRSFRSFAAEVWNSIPFEIRSTADLRGFRLAFFDLLLRNPE